jgi:FAD/FMN-containing dehydrogenase
MQLRKSRVVLCLSVAILGVLAFFFGKPAYLLVDAWLHDRPSREPLPAGFVDDASRLNQTRVAEVVDVPADPDEAVRQLAKLLERARREKLGVAIAGARHSMGGHTIAPDGIVLNILPFNHMELDADRRLLRVGAGARWSQIIPYLDSRGFAVAVMQSNNDFSVGGSLSVNAHGWQVNRPPIASTVESLRLMKADGTVVRCSRSENAELFSLVLGGYGLCGIILEAELHVVPNESYRAEAEVLATSEYVARFAATVTDETPMAYGRLCIVPGEAFLKEAILTRFRKAPGKPGNIPPLTAVGYHKLRREVYRAQIGHGAGKELRWKLEKKLGESFRDRFFSRNQLMGEPAAVYQEQNADRTDILYEYFIPSTRFEEFLTTVRPIVPKHPVDLLNVTVRNVLEDKDTFLRWADGSMFCFVMLFNHPRGAEADAAMEAFTREMIDAALSCGGRYYLPYRLHGSVEQFRRAYPQAAKFFAKKRQYDPDEVFVNQFYAKYAR